MGLRKVLFLLVICLSILSVNAFGQDGDDSPFSYSNESSPEYATLDELNDAEELIKLKERLLLIESMLLAQKDRENELLRDLNKFVLANKEQPKEPTQTQKNLEAAQEQFKAEAAALQQKINTLEAALVSGHERDLQMGQEMNKMIIVTVSVVVGIGLFVFLITVYLQYRLMSRPVQPIYVQQPAHLALETVAGQLPVEASNPISPTQPQETGLVENTKVEETNERFLSAIERLEARIMHMEDGLAHADAQLNRTQKVSPMGNRTPETLDETIAEAVDFGKPSESDEPAMDEESPKEEAIPLEEAVSEIKPEEMDPASVEEEGKRLLQVEDWKGAFKAFDHLINLDDTKVDNWVNRGRALEMLKREEAAIESYDQAIKINPDLPSPFLYKAALLSRMERFEEAQKFYNEALSKVPMQKDERATAAAR